jgi:hypothetical protein
MIPNLAYAINAMIIQQSWWHNPVNPDSLRLTRPAFNMLNKNKDIKNWHFKLPTELVNRSYIQLEKHFISPYYISGPK